MIRPRKGSTLAINTPWLLAIAAVGMQLVAAHDTAHLKSELDSCEEAALNGTSLDLLQGSRPEDRDQKTSSRSCRVQLEPGRNYMSGRQTDIAEEIFFYDVKEDQPKEQSLARYSFMILMMKIVGAAYNDYMIHHYDTFEELRDSNPAETNQETCLKYLTELNERADASAKLGYRSSDIEVLRTMDTFGRQQSGTLAGDIFWTGSYDTCKRLTIRYQDNQKTRNRYCIASLRFGEQMAANELEQMAAIKTAVCLPRVCDAQPYKDKYQLIWQLVRFSVPDLDKFGARLGRLHCLPDEGSPLRTWWQSRPTLLVVGCASAWILLLVFATYKDERRAQVQKVTDEATTNEDQDRRTNIYRSLSITNNLRSLFRVDKKDANGLTEEKLAPQATIVNLDMIEGIKVLAACYIITGHVIMIATMITKDGQELGQSTSISYLLSNLMPAFAVNAFFVITGILTSYLIFKQNQSHSLITSPIKWLAFIFYRYLRIMPMYALMTLFCKHVARYIGDGPLWDYGTSSLAARRTCEQESWAWTLLFGANLKSPLKHCIPSAWYLANDFQFFIVTPILMLALHKRPQFGKVLLISAIIAGSLAGFVNILTSATTDIRPIAQFMPHGFMTYITFLHDSYTRPQYRIPAYLVGLLLGHSLYEYERRRKVQLDEEEANKSQQEAEKDDQQQQLTETAVLVIVTPSVGSRLPLDKFSARLLVSFIMPAYHLLYALSIGIYILLATTGHGNKFINGILSMKFWKPLARLSLCVVLVNVEVISFIVQTHRRFQVLDNQYHTCLNLLSILSTYLVATVVCVLFEAPVRALLNHVLAFAMQRAAIKNKKKTA